ncbi:PREDICTED: mediator of RNA polymerase II transcription subunit 17 [Ceratosolen solmsi marchali]|uniref:Mediator of RNA polymerase II transcription subunit 17 n=1 Tax=Ceratosolen solmsi marchali TaxID=326594 RepID=A0AAJ6YLF1_9HYME|nr:PREDICTED: mediator of RNA polymerase II transcription subunit 17 [Ceratosolen solmsi marchali]
MAYSVNVSVEAPIENQIQEITYDGQEIYQAPLTLSENLAKIAQKIDFTKTNGEDVNKEQENGEKSEEDTKDPANFQSSLWPWDSVRNKLRNALTEVCVLADVLAVAKEKRYMVLDPVPQDSIEVKPLVQVHARKKALAGAASVLIMSADRMKNCQNELARTRTTPDFHIELLRLRQNWRLKKVSNSIIGDLSYRTAGSKYNQTGMFEITKAEEEEKSSTSPPVSPNPNIPTPSSSSTNKNASALRVTIPSELEGIAYIEVLCKKDQEALCSANINWLNSGSGNKLDPDTHWQQKLEAAQNVLFCKELFSQLAREAVHLRAPIPHMVVGNRIMATVLPGIQLIIILRHSTGHDKKPVPQNTDHDHVLEHSLHQLLREVHHKNTHHPYPHPSSGPLGPSKRRCIAGPTAVDRHELIEMTKSQTLLEQIIQQAQHFFMRLRTEYVLDTIAKEVKDPLIVSHWNALNSPTQSSVRIIILTHGYDQLIRTSMILHVSEKSLRCVCKDGRVMYMSYEPQELRDLIFCQIYQHQINAVQGLAKCMGWQFLANSSHLGLGAVEPLGNASSCILASPIGDRMIAVRCEPQTGIQVSIAHSPRKDFFPGQLVKERKWENLGGSFKEVRWDKMEGKNFLNKMELLMASLTSS